MTIGEIRHAVRRARNKPGASLACVALLAIGIGVCTAAFSAVDALLLATAPFRDADRLVEQTLGYSEPALVEAWRASGLFDAVEAGRSISSEIETETGTVTEPVAAVTTGVFDLLDVHPLVGRRFSPGPNALSEVVLSEAAWGTLFARDPTVLGRRIRVNAGEAIIVGIMPGTFRFPTPDTVAWITLPLRAREPGLFTIFGRLKAGVPLEVASTHTQALARELARLPSNYVGGPPLSRIGDPRLDAVTIRALWLLLTGAVLLFAIMAANVLGLLLTGLTTRRRELGICMAIGASRGRILRELALEHGAIAATGVVAGIWLASLLIAALPEPYAASSLNVIDLDRRAIIAGSLFGSAAVVVAGVAPGWFGTVGDPAESLRTGGRWGGEPAAARLITRLLLSIEIALACSLLVGSLLLLRSFIKMRTTDLGLDAREIVRLRVLAMDEAFGSAEGMRLGMSALRDRLAAWPAVRAIALSRELPPGPTRGELLHFGPPGTRPDPSASVRADVYRVDRAFFDLYRIRLLHGRTFAFGDTAADVVVSERLAQRLWPGDNPIGQTFSAGSLSEPRRVLGVVAELRLPTFDSNLERPELYTLLGSESRTLYLNLRCHTECPSTLSIEGVVQGVDPRLRVRAASVAEDEYRRQLRVPAVAGTIGAAFAGLALFTAAAGLFTVLVCAVARRRREFGILAAVGASPAAIRRGVMWESCIVSGAGMLAGTVGGWAVGRSLSAFHYEVTSADPVTWVVMCVTMILATLAAAWYPSLVASRVDPVTLLREE